MRWPFGPPHLTLKPSKIKTKNKKKQKKEGLGSGEVARRKQKQIKKKNKQKKKENKGQKKNYKNTKKELFNDQSIFSFSLVGVQNCPFWQLLPKGAHPKNTIKIGVSATHFVENNSESRNGHFWTKKPNPKIPVIIFFASFFSYTTTKNTKISWNPYFISVLADPKKIIFKF